MSRDHQLDQTKNILQISYIKKTNSERCSAILTTADDTSSHNSLAICAFFIFFLEDSEGVAPDATSASPILTRSF